MENGINAYLMEQFRIPAVDLRTYSPLTLAYIGDSIFDLIIRSLVVAEGNARVSDLHKKASRIVKAQTQARMAEILRPLLTKEEEDIYRRGRNAKSFTMAKNATVADYRKATGVEALLGWLYLKNEFPRLTELVKAGLSGLSSDCGGTGDEGKEGA